MGLHEAEREEEALTLPAGYLDTLPALVWFVSTHGTDGLREVPVLMEGTVTGAGELRVVMVWSHRTYATERPKRHEVERDLSATPGEAWKDATMRLARLRDAFQADANTASCAHAYAAEQAARAT